MIYIHKPELPETYYVVSTTRHNLNIWNGTALLASGHTKAIKLSEANSKPL